MVGMKQWDEMTAPALEIIKPYFLEGLKKTYVVKFDDEFKDFTVFRKKAHTVFFESVLR